MLQQSERRKPTNCHNFKKEGTPKNIKQIVAIDLRLFPALQSLPVMTSASRSSFPVDNPLAEKKESRDFQVTEEATRSIPLLIKWPLSFNVDGSSPKARAMEPRSILCSSEATSSCTTFESEGHRSLIALGFFSDILRLWWMNEWMNDWVISLSEIGEVGFLNAFYAFSFRFQFVSNGFWKCLWSHCDQRRDPHPNNGQIGSNQINALCLSYF